MRPSDLDLCCLQKSIIIARGSEKVKTVNNKTTGEGGYIDFTGTNCSLYFQILWKCKIKFVHCLVRIEVP